MNCHFHPDRQAVYSGGYSRCIECAGQLDRDIIDAWIMNLDLGLSLEIVRKILTVLFGTSDYRFSAFNRLYDRFDRGKWLSVQEGYQIPQMEYIQNAFLKFIKGEGACLMPRRGSRNLQGFKLTTLS